MEDLNKEDKPVIPEKQTIYSKATVSVKLLDKVILGATIILVLVIIYAVIQ